MTDLCAPEIHLWQWMEARAREVMRRCDCQEVRTPVVERLEVFVRALGEGTDVVQKEMYAFEDRGGRRVALRPEGTAGVMRHAAGAVAPGQGARLYYLGPMFRAERPQAGRKRQFHQLGMESLGAPSPAADAECISALLELFEAWGLDGFEVRVHTRGLPDDQRAVREGLIERARPLADRLCDDCRRRLDSHPLRLLDCKQSGCRTALADLPPITQFMSAESRAYLDETMRLLEVMGIPARVDPLLIRGLDYYMPSRLAAADH
jgi:histidyl-tRNA synthetase